MGLGGTAAPLGATGATDLGHLRRHDPVGGAAEGQKQGDQPLIGGLDVTVNRNYFGRQADSFETLLDAPRLGADPVPAIFIRAPAITQAGPAWRHWRNCRGRRLSA